MSENTVKHEHKQCGGKNIEKMEEIGKTMPVEEEIYDVAELFKVLGDQTRVKILFTLIKDEMCVCDIAEMLKSHLLDFARRSRQAEADPPVDVLLADTTGEMLKLMNGADIVIMGKSLAGHDEGHNLIEPALLDKPIVTGHVLRNFRFILNVLLQENAVATVTHDSELEEQLRKLLVNKELREELGKRAGRTIRKHAGATERTVNELESLLKK